MAGDRAPGLCVSGASSLQPEATSHADLGCLSCLNLVHQVDGGGVGMGKWVCTTAALFFPVMSTTMNSDHLGWNVASASLRSAE